MEAGFTRQHADRAAAALTAAAADGDLIDLEIGAAVGKIWTVRRTEAEITVVARFAAGYDISEQCQTYRFALPLTAGSVPARSAGSTCPEVTAHIETGG